MNEPTVVQCAASCSVSVYVAPARATADDYEAAGVLFGAFLGAAVVVWAAKRVLRLFERQSES